MAINMSNKSFDFLGDDEKIKCAKEIEEAYWNYYFNCDDWGVDDIDFHLRIIYTCGDNPKITIDEFNKIIKSIETD